MKRFCSSLLFVLACSLCMPLSRVEAQVTRTEELDVTRLDVERLPPEAIEINRGMYAHGVYVEGHVGGRGIIGGAGRLLAPGLLASVNAGYELTPWLLVGGGMELSLHPTDAPSPPTPTTLQLFGAFAELRVQANLSSRVGLWLGGQIGVTSISGNFLSTYGVQKADSLGAMFGGELGLDWHFKNRHHSIGLLGGARLYPSLEGFDGEQAIGVHSTAYLRYVF